jgi:hypothetical protein
MMILCKVYYTQRSLCKVKTAFTLRKCVIDCGYGRMHAKESRAMERELKEPESYQKSTSRVSQTKQNPYFSFQCLFHLKVKPLTLPISPIFLNF